MQILIAGIAYTGNGAGLVVVVVVVVVTCTSYYNTGNYATIEDRTTDDKQINYKDRYNHSSSAVFLCGAEDVWWGNQEILGVGNRHDSILIQ